MATQGRTRSQDLYEEDFYVWTEAQAALLRERRFEALDLANLIEEVEAFGRTERSKTLNIASVIIELSKSMYGLLAPGGTLISSGIFFERGDAVKSALERAGLPVREERKEGDWLCLVSVREQ